MCLMGREAAISKEGEGGKDCASPAERRGTGERAG